MKQCELCGHENPDGARFCMKCAQDLDQVKHDDPFDAPDYDGFLPAATLEDARLASTASVEREDKGPMPDFSTYVPQPSVLQQQDYEADARAAEEEGTPEIQQQGITTDFTEKQAYCDLCGVRNARDQRRCGHCGSPLGDEGDPWVGVESSTSSAPMATAPVELSSLANISPSSHFSTPTVQERKAGRQRRSSTRAAAGKLIAAIVVLLVLAGALWLFAFGGMKVFSSSVRNIKKAAGVMSKQPGYDFSVVAAIDGQTGQSQGSGDVKYATPDRSLWVMTASLAGRPPTTLQQVTADGKTMFNSGAGWQQSPQKRDVGMLWGGISSAENLGMAALGPYSCYHYKYNANPKPFTSLLGDPDPQGVSDAVVEIWIDNSTFFVRKLKAKIYNARVQDARASVTFDFDLSSTGTPYDIKAPL